MNTITILGRVGQVTATLGLPGPRDMRGVLTNPKGNPWKQRHAPSLKGLVWHQELAGGDVESVARYHTGPDSHLKPKDWPAMRAWPGAESIAYTFAIRRDGQICGMNETTAATWSQGYADRAGDENAEFMSVMFEGFFKALSVTDPKAGEPTAAQLTAGLVLWRICQAEWKWNDGCLYGHYHFGKPACPGATLQAIVEATRFNVPPIPHYDFSNVQDRQSALNRLLKLNPPLKIDGWWASKSRAACKALEARYGLTQDGVWDSALERRAGEEMSGE